MNRHKILSIFVVIILASTTAGTAIYCSLETKSGNTPDVLHIEFEKVDSYGNCVMNISSDDLFNAGYELGDYVLLSWDGREMRALIVTKYTGLFTFEEFVNVTEDRTVTIGCQCASSPIEVDDKVTVSYMGKSHREEILPCTFAGKCDRQEWMTDEDFVNFRNVTTTGMKTGILYRSSNVYPLSTDARASTVDDVIGRYDPNVLVGLKETEETILNNIISGKVNVLNADDYLFEDRIFTDAMTVRYLEDRTYDRVFQYIADNDGPYLVFCSLGKDRTGFVCIMLEALMGATYQEMLDDFLLTYVCLYNVNKDSQEYKELRGMFNPILAGLHDPSIMSHIEDINFEKIDVTGYNYREDAEKYLSDNLGLSQQTIQKIKDRLNA